MSKQTKKAAAGRTKAGEPRKGFGAWVNLRFGSGGARLVALAGSLVLKAVVAFFAYIVTFWIAVQGTPAISLAVLNMTGPTAEEGLAGMIAKFLLPTGFLLAAAFALLYAGTRAAWRWQARTAKSMRRALLIDDEPGNAGEEAKK